MGRPSWSTTPWYLVPTRLHACSGVMGEAPGQTEKQDLTTTSEKVKSSYCAGEHRAKQRSRRCLARGLGNVLALSCLRNPCVACGDLQGQELLGCHTKLGWAKNSPVVRRSSPLPDLPHGRSVGGPFRPPVAQATKVGTFRSLFSQHSRFPI